jgi:hypothetical protein
MIRDSPGLDIASRLHALGGRVTVNDPLAMGNALMACPRAGVRRLSPAGRPRCGMWSWSPRRGPNSARRALLPLKPP